MIVGIAARRRRGGGEGGRGAEQPSITLWHTWGMLVRFVLGVIVFWLVLSVIRSATEAPAPRNPHYRRGAPLPGIKAKRREALAVLGLYDGAKAAEIKKAYRDLAAKYHPDRVAHLGPELVELTSEKFKQINAAYDFLNGK